MMPIGLLMKEHRLIERMIKIMQDKLQQIHKKNEPDLKFIDTACDFLRAYADKCHHGKEEDILFVRLDEKLLSKEHKNTMENLIKDHITARKTVAGLIEARQRYEKQDKSALKDILSLMKDLVSLYPRHIEVEDKHFFIPCMDYFDKGEQAKILEEFYDFDKTLVHKKYTEIVEQMKKT